MKYFGFSDILKRWVYTRQGLYKLTKSEDFPEPVFTLDGGRTRVWLSLDIVDYELMHPEVLDEKLKRAKVASFARCEFKRRNGIGS